MRLAIILFLVVVFSGYSAYRAECRHMTVADYFHDVFTRNPNVRTISLNEADSKQIVGKINKATSANHTPDHVFVFVKEGVPTILVAFTANGCVTMSSELGSKGEGV